MAGGIYSDLPFVVNPKCLAFAGAICLLYWLATSTEFTYWLLPLLFVGAYVSMAWYDWAYGCDVKLKSGTLGIDAGFKPQYDSDPGDKDKSIFLFHLVALSVILYSGYVGYATTSENVFLFVQWLAGAGIAYHGWRLISV